MCCRIVVRPPSSVSSRVVRVSGQSAPHDSVETSRSGGATSWYTPVIDISLPSSRRQTKRQAPPGRRSTSQIGMVQPSGPSIQCGRCSGLVKASKTSRHGASTTRVITNSRSDGISYVVVPVSLAMVIVALLLLHPLQVLVQPGVAGVPEPPVVLGPLGDLLQRSRLEPARAPLRFPAPDDETGQLEHPQVLGDGGPAHRERRRELLHRRRPLGQPGEDGPAGRVGEGSESGAQGVRCHPYQPIGYLTM